MGIKEQIFWIVLVVIGGLIFIPGAHNELFSYPGVAGMGGVLAFRVLLVLIAIPITARAGKAMSDSKHGGWIAFVTFAAMIWLGYRLYISM